MTSNKVGRQTCHLMHFYEVTVFMMEDNMINKKKKAKLFLTIKYLQKWLQKSNISFPFPFSFLSRRVKFSPGTVLFSIRNEVLSKNLEEKELSKTLGWLKSLDFILPHFRDFWCGLLTMQLWSLHLGTEQRQHISG